MIESQNKLIFPEWYTKRFFLNLFGFFSAVGSTLAVLTISAFTYNGDLATWRSSTFGGQAGNHILTELAILFLMWFIVWKRSTQIAWGKRLKVLLRESDVFFDAALTALFVCSIVQILWYLPYLGIYGYTNLMIPRWLPYPPYIGSLWMIVSPVGIALYTIYHKGLSKSVAYFIMAMSVFYIGWFVIGFPITLRFEGATDLLMNDGANGLEILSWWWAALWWLLLAEGYLKLLL